MGVLDFLGNLFGGQGQAQLQPAQGLTDPSLYQPQQPPEFKLPFAYKLALLGQSVNRSYGGKGGMDVGGLAEAYMKQQQDQYAWQQDQAERQRKIALARKYIEKTGNTQLADLLEADPDGTLKLIFGIEAEKAKPREDKYSEVNKGLYNTTTHQWEIQPPAEPPPKDYSYLVNGGETGGAAPAESSTAIPVAGPGTGAMGETPAPDTAVVPLVKPPTASAPEFPDIDTTGVTESGVKTIGTLKSNLVRMVQPFDRELTKLDAAQLHGDIDPEKYFGQRRELLAQRKDAIDKTYDDMRNAAAADIAQQAAETKAASEKKARETVSVTAGQTVLDTSDPDHPKVIYKAEQAETTDQRNARMLADPTVSEEVKKALREAMRSGTPLPQSVDDQLAIKEGELRITDAHALAKANVTAGDTAKPLLGTLKTVQSLLPGMPQGLTKDPNALAAFILPSWNKNADIVRKANAYMAPQLRVIGSGSSSDADVNLNQVSLSSALDRPEVNAAITAMAIGRFQIAMDRSDLSLKYSAGDISLKAFYAGLREINNRDITPQLIKDMLASGELQRDEAAPVTGTATESPTNITDDLNTLKQLRAGGGRR